MDNTTSRVALKITYQASLTVRVNEEFNTCRVSKGRDQIVEISGTDRSDQCANMPGRIGGRVCVRATRGVPSCILNIDRVEANMEGVWRFTIDKEVRNRNISKDIDLELVMVELPDALFLRFNNQQYRDGERESSVTAELGRINVECEVDGGRPTPVINLFAGGRNVTDEGSGGKFCRSSGRNSACVQFDVDITADMSGESLRF